MEVLGLDKEPVVPIRLPVSAYPDWANAYFCDACDRDVTKRIWSVQGHSTPPLGPQRFICDCGAKWLSGKVEWDHLDTFGRRSRYRGLLLGLGLISVFGLGLGFLLVGVLLGLGMSFQRAMLLGTAVVFLPGLVLVLGFGVVLLRSICRTRLGFS